MRAAAGAVARAWARPAPGSGRGAGSAAGGGGGVGLTVGCVASRRCACLGAPAGARARETSTHSALTRPRPPPRRSETLATTRAFAPADVAAFLALSGDANPVHTAPAPAGAGAGGAGGAGPLLPGLLTAALFPGLVGSAVPGSVYASQTLRFIAPAACDAPVTATAVVEAVTPLPARGVGRAFAARATLRTRAWSGGVLAVDGSAVALLPRRGGGG